MSLEHKLKTEEKGLLRRFLNSAKSKISKTIFGAALAAMPVSGCDGGGGSHPAPTPINNAPNFTSTPVTSVWEGNAYNYDADAVDPEGDNPVTYSLVSGPSWASMDANGIVSGTPTGYSANTLEGFTVRATDSKGNSRNQNFNVNVTNLGTVSGTVTDIDNNALVSKTVDLWNSTYAKGRFTATTDGSGNFTIADTVAGGNNVPNLNNWNYEIGDGYTGIFKFLRPNEITSGDTHVMTQPAMILMHTVSTTGGTGGVYLNSLGPSFLALTKFETQRRTTDFPTGGPHPTRTWPSFPVSVFLDASNAPSADNELANGSAGSNGVSDYVDRIRVALAEWNTKSGMTLFNEVFSDPSTGIKVIYNPSLPGNGNTNHISYDTTTGTNKYKTVEIKTGLGTSTVEGTAKHEFGHTIYNINHSADNIYILYINGNASGIIHNDEGRVAKYISKLPHGTNMDWYVDQ